MRRRKAMYEQDDFEFEPIDKIQVAFERFHHAHPEVYRLFLQYAMELRRAGRERFSADAILHRIRWHHAVNPNREFDGFKINDHFSSRYARKLASDHPGEFGSFFETRKLRRDRA